MRPKYEIVKTALLNRLDSGHLKPGDKFYSESELIQEFGVSSITVIRAITELVNEGYLVRYQGKGTFVATSKRRKLVRYTDHDAGDHSNLRTEVLIAEAEHDPAILKQLGLYQPEYCVHIRRVRYEGDTPISLIDSYLNRQLIREEKLATDKTYYASIYSRISEDAGINMIDCPYEETMSIVPLVDEADTVALGLKGGDLAVQVEHKTSLPGRGVIEYVRSRKRPEFFNIKLETV